MLFVVVGISAWVRLLFIDTHPTFPHGTRSSKCATRRSVDIRIPYASLSPSQPYGHIRPPTHFTSQQEPRDIGISSGNPRSGRPELKRCLDMQRVLVIGHPGLPCAGNAVANTCGKSPVKPRLRV
ncbi:hypothetical protein IW261DRAFT_1117182 [Armillaria novae-zelandiae]|uniref:Uncharacterized protein n=1 Tax=Armillaria novae-zelandiae TaxID=153914 RepID=A0AA39NJ31_9AGAR|nr:hypothetical protein IW261DRAFT_1117182 [Armillaria novae-zelandiae]